MENMPPGFRFYPTEEELVSFYLHHKLERKREDLNLRIDRIIPIVDIYGFNPWDLPQFSLSLCHKDPEQWFFFIPMRESEAKGGKPSRLTANGYWKATGSPGFVYSSGNRPIGVKRTMVFYKGRAPNGRKTEWKMNEYKAIDEATSSDINISATPTLRHEFSLCRVYKKSKCMPSFDRRPSSAGGGVQISEPPAEAHHQDQGQSTVEAAAAAAAAATQCQSPQMAAERSMNSFLGDHDGYLSQSCNDSPAMLVDYDDLFWNIDGFWDSME